MRNRNSWIGSIYAFALVAGIFRAQTAQESAYIVGEFGDSLHHTRLGFAFFRHADAHDTTLGRRIVSVRAADVDVDGRHG